MVLIFCLVSWISLCSCDLDSVVVSIVCPLILISSLLFGLILDYPNKAAFGSSISVSERFVTEEFANMDPLCIKLRWPQSLAHKGIQRFQVW